MHLTFESPENAQIMSIKRTTGRLFPSFPEKIRHFRTKSMFWSIKLSIGARFRAGDFVVFGEEDYPCKAILAGEAELVQELYQDQHLIIVNKPEGMKTHANEPTELALLNHVSAYVGETSLCGSQT